MHTEIRYSDMKNKNYLKVELSTVSLNKLAKFSQECKQKV